MREIIDDNCLGLAAQLAFYFLLALFPALVVLVALISLLPVDGVMVELLAPLSRVAPSDVLDLVRTQLDHLAAGDRSGLLTLGILGAIWSSSAAMVAIIDTLIGPAAERSHQTKLRRIWRDAGQRPPEARSRSRQR